jgi:hypothetical protein
MHIPAWEQALGHLCQVLKPGGHLLLFESNQRALETWLARGVRLLRTNESTMQATPGGLEFWSARDGCPYLVRIANINSLCRALRANGVEVAARFATEFWDVLRFPPWLRHGIVRWNQLWFALRLPAWLSAENCVIGVKR